MERLTTISREPQLPLPQVPLGLISSGLSCDPSDGLVATTRVVNIAPDSQNTKCEKNAAITRGFTD